MWFDDAVARHDIAKQVIKLAKKGKIYVQLVLSPRSNAIQELPKTAKQPKKRKLNFSSPAIGIRLVGGLYGRVVCHLIDFPRGLSLKLRSAWRVA